MIEKKDRLLENFLNLTWLRPENALTMTIRSKSVKDLFAEMKSPSIDISGGDGIFSFLTCGGELDKSFDIFVTVSHLDKVRSDKADIYDYYDNTYNPIIIKKPNVFFDYYSDWKQNLLNKAKKLNFYKNLVLQNNNKKLIFESNYFNFIYSNSIYWVENIDYFLKELYRITNNNALVVLHVKNNLQFEDTFRDLSSLDKKCKDILDRGRKATYKGLASFKMWKKRFINIGFQIEDIKPIFTKDIRNINDIGLRPFAPMLIKMVNSLPTEKRLEIKKQWVDLAYDIIECLAIPNASLGLDKRVAEHLFILRKK